METNLVDEALRRLETWLKASKMSESRLGQLACANARAVERVRAGTGSVASLRALLAYIDQNPAETVRRQMGGQQ